MTGQDSQGLVTPQVEKEPDRGMMIVTGGTSGIGRAIVNRLCQKHDVMIIGRSCNDSSRVTDDGAHTITEMQCDIRSTTNITRVSEAVAAAKQPLSGLVNCAGILRLTEEGADLTTAAELWDDVINTNLRGAYLITEACAPYLRRPGGRIVNVSSVAAYTGGLTPYAAAYAASKAGLIGLTYAQSRKWGKEGITANAVAPGLITDTAIVDTRPPDWQASLIDEILAGRAGVADEVAATVEFLMSKDAAYIAGEVINVNGGLIFGR